VSGTASIGERRSIASIVEAAKRCRSSQSSQRMLKLQWLLIKDDLKLLLTRDILKLLSTRDNLKSP
jgi:hypothetical protein